MTSGQALLAVMWVGLTLYALLAGADFGAGFWDLLSGRGQRGRDRRDLIEHVIGPVWEANHVWLIIVVVLLFTGFLSAFSAVMTTLHVPLSLMLIGVVLRGSAFTFRSYDNTEVGFHQLRSRSPAASPAGTRPDAMAPATVPRKNGVSTDEDANAAPNTRRCHGTVLVLRNAKAAPRAMMPSAARVSGTYRVDITAAKTGGNPVHSSTRMKMSQTWLASHTGPMT